MFTLKYSALLIGLAAPLAPAQLTSSLCTSYADSSFKPSSLYRALKVAVDKADELLVPNIFDKAIDGFLVTLVDEEDGEEAGGGTNTFGAYGTFLFDGSKFPPEFCPIPSASGNSRCAVGPGGATTSFILGPSDVIAFAACTPPEMAYFSYDFIIDVRLTEAYPFYPGQNFGDTINYLNVNVSNSAVPFNQPAIFVASGDNTRADTVAHAYMQSTGLGAESVSTRGITGETVRFENRTVEGGWSSPDILSFISRYTAPAGGIDDVSYNAYKSIKWPVRLYLAPDDAISTDPLHPPLYDRCNELVVNETSMLSESFSALNQSVQNALSKEFGPFVGNLRMNMTAEGFYDDWDVVLNNKNNDSFVAGTRDATYGIPYEFQLYSGGLLAVIIGALHTATFNASYNSVGLDVVMDGVYLESHWWLNTDLEGSAARYLPEGHAAAPYLFAVEVRPPGGCEGFNGREQWCQEFNASTNDISNFPNYLMPGERVYALKQTHVGSCASATISAEVQVFKYSAA